MTKKIISVLIGTFIILCCQGPEDLDSITVDFAGKTPIDVEIFLKGRWKIETVFGGFCANCTSVPVNDVLEFNFSQFKWKTGDIVVSSGTIVWQKDQDLNSNRWTMSNFGITPDGIKNGKLFLNEEQAAADGFGYTLSRIK